MAGFLGAYTILGMGETNNLYIMIGIIAIKIFGVVLSFGAEFYEDLEDTHTDERGTKED